MFYFYTYNYISKISHVQSMENNKYCVTVLRHIITLQCPAFVIDLKVQLDNPSCLQ